MRKTLAIAGIFTVAALAAPAAYAQSMGADTTCSDFVSMDSTAQADLAANLGMGGAAMSSDSSSAMSADKSTDSGGTDSTDESGDLDNGGTGMQAGGGMDAAAVLAACQANPNGTVGAAISAGK